MEYTLQMIKTVSLSQQIVNYQYCFYPKDKLRISKLYDKWLPKKYSLLSKILLWIVKVKLTWKRHKRNLKVLNTILNTVHSEYW